ncbi:hypothetical protein EPUS_01020 [Endocarpon pusillum Z07020]|uniref:Uncharacterized protein n=1 Tax=Endocarpon pusillum (strain Z07020 / HMAS-L-300199) TaxID=1263415 RepID=U1HJG3_ENDPU|nr:uncharacterized protein EPUS_01020 [Endocarpon pusillum Z07020]ERF69064.1 hypothetical protein EPUS_01020 [Endocarpon pusillum Z07020]
MAEDTVCAASSSIIEEVTGDLFDSPDNAVLIHACNCLGSWGAGIAKAFRTKYPAAYKVHNDYCKATSNDSLIGTTQLIPPQHEDYKKADSGLKKKHWIACLFTSVGYGKPTKTRPGMDKPDAILENTRKSLKDLKTQLSKIEHEAEGDGVGTIPGEMWSCKINSGLFAVDWADTRRVMEEELKSLGRTVTVVSPERS